MDRAAKAVRRSGVRLLSLGGGHADLNVVISELKDVRNGAKSFVTAQNSAAEYVSKWATGEENRAIQDVSDQVVELNLLWTDVQRDFLEHLKEYRHSFDMILEGEKRVAQSRANLAVQEQRESKAKRDLKKAAKKGMTEDLRHLENKYLQAERARSLAQLEVADVERENEAVKLIRFKEGLLKISNAYADMAERCSIIFQAQKDIALQLPDVNESDVNEPKYVGAGQSKRYVLQARDRLLQQRRKPLSTKEDPPPPYSYVELPEAHQENINLCSEYVPCEPAPRPAVPIVRPIVDIEGYVDRNDRRQSPDSAGPRLLAQGGPDEPGSRLAHNPQLMGGDLQVSSSQHLHTERQVTHMQPSSCEIASPPTSAVHARCDSDSGSLRPRRNSSPPEGAVAAWPRSTSYCAKSAPANESPQINKYKTKQSSSVGDVAQDLLTSAVAATKLQ